MNAIHWLSHNALTCYMHIFLLKNKMTITQSSFAQVPGTLTEGAFICKAAHSATLYLLWTWQLVLYIVILLVFCVSATETVFL
jgi:hypothetical protein